MSTMTIVKTGQADIGDLELVTLEITGPSNYQNEGELFPVEDVGFRVGSQILSFQGVTNQHVQPIYDKATGKLVWFDEDGEVGDGSDLSGETAVCTVIGK